ncbi:MAG: adenylate/guanylate cyclase domain-containing protein [Candidatus Cloacimonetes bacterium]|nr:adenylate/guanylate cyclase domain-containing protein [Candidatus Cloacimonadota bacterium]MCF7813722.1 adenylate/guanylate cyclase domain-containing protein [Candidatus Cloacimonadota bacterium]MCF7867788.1 adenylate/guanylate cyclase domain-containing protein [Candidatus Cloacimonadota bacterium]MCF7883234.1 adenylate/guanylate cyclase domain-containing protein [Candidatus Cloacimonadota bacterium]
MFRNSKTDKLKFIIVPIAIFIVLEIVFLSSFWQSLEHKAKDLFFIMRGAREISENVVIVEIGDETFNVLNESWPFPRDYHAHLIENLQKAGVKEIIFDIEFTERSDVEADEYLASVAGKYDNIVIAGKLIKTIYDSSTREQFLTPIRPFMERNVKWGMVNITADEDGFVRKYEIIQKRKDEVKPSIGLLALADVYGISPNSSQFQNNPGYFRLGDNFIPKYRSKSVLLNYFGPARHFPYFDYAQVIDDSTFTTDFEKSIESDLNEFNELKPILKDKIVLIGLTAVEFHDLHHTPFFSQDQRLTPGVEIHANFIEMVLQHDYLQEFSFFIFLGIFLFIGIILFIINFNLKPSISFILNLIMIVIYVGFAYYIFTSRNTQIPVLEIPLLIIITYISGLIFQYIKTVRERKFIKQAFGQYIAPELVEELIKDPRKLEYGGKQMDLSVIYADIVSFTPYTESHSAKETVEIVREYLSAMVEVIMENQGTLDKFVGDEIIALFGAPVPLEDHAFRACKAAIEMRLKMNELKEKWIAEKRDPVDIGIGLNSGTMIVGNLGSEQIFDYTAIGDNMNAGARIEALTRNYKTRNNILISESTYNLCSDKIIAEFVDEATVKGKSIPVKVFELIGIKKEANTISTESDKTNSIQESQDEKPEITESQ